MSRLTRQAVAYLALFVLWPGAVFGQAGRAGVVTTLEGTVTATRAALPQPVPLRFKDDVFLQDRIVAGDRSLARLLLGGKAVVTVRERSSLTLTELPGQSIVALDAGKIAVAVARDRLRAGETIEIRTPNAVAGIRGTVVIAEVIRTTAQVGGATPGVLTRFYVLRGAIIAAFADPTGRLSGQVTVNANETVTIAGTAPPRVSPTTPQQQAEAQSGLQPSAPQHTQAANQEQVTETAVSTTVALVNALLGPGAPAEIVGAPAPTTTETTIGTTEQAPINPGNTSNLAESGGGGGGGATTAPTIGVTSAVFTAGDFFTVALGESLTTAQPLLRVTDSAFVVDGGSVLDVLGNLTSTATTSFLAADPSVLRASGSLVAVGPHADPDGELTLGGPLVSAADTALSFGGTMLRIDGALHTTAPLALASLARSPVFAGGGLIDMCCSFPALSLDRLLDAAQSPITTGDDVLAISLSSAAVAARLEGLSTAPFIGLDTSPVAVSFDQIVTVGVSSGLGAALALGGSLLGATASPLVTDADAIEIDVRASGATAAAVATLDVTGPSALVSLNRSPAVSLDDAVLELGASGSQRAAVTLASSLLSAVQSPLFAGDDDLLDASVSGCCNPGAAGVLTTTSAAALVSLDRSPAVSLFDEIVALDISGSAQATLGLGGPALGATRSLLVGADPSNAVLTVWVSACCEAGGTASVTTPAGQPFVMLDRSPVFSEESLLALDVSAAGTAGTASVSVGSLLGATRSPIVADDEPTIALSVAGGAGAGGSGTFTGLGPGALLSLNPSPLYNEDGGILGLSVSGNTAAVTLAGRLLDAIDSPLHASDEAVAVNVSGSTSGSLTYSGPAGSALVSLLRSPVVVFDDFLGLCCANLTATLPGPVLAATGSPLKVSGTLVSIDSGASLTLGAGQPLISLAGSPALTDGSLLFFDNPGTLTLSGPLMSTDSPLVSFSNGIEVQGTITSTAGRALVPLDRIVMSAFAGVVTLDPGGTVNLSAPALAATGALLSLSDQALFVDSGTLLTAAPTGSPYPVVSLDGGALWVGGASGAVYLRGTATAADGEVNPVTSAPTGLSLGTQQPLQHSGGGPVLAVAGGAAVTVGGGDAVRLERARLDVAAPLVSLGPDSALTLGGNAIDVVRGGRLASSAGPLALVDRGTLSAMGHLVNVSHVFEPGIDGSRLRVADDLLVVADRGVVNLAGGAILAVSGGSIAEVGGALVRFAGAGGNVVNVANALAPTSFVLGVPVHVAVGATAEMAITGTPLPGLGTLGSIVINGVSLPVGAVGDADITGSLIAFLGRGGTVVVTGGSPAFTAPAAPPLPSPPAGTALVALVNQRVTLASGSLIGVTPGEGNAMTLNLAPPPPFVSASGPSPDIGGAGGGPTLALTNSTVSALDTAAALVSVTGTSVTADGPLIAAAGSSIHSRRPLLDLASSVTSGGVLHLSGGATAVFQGVDAITLDAGETLAATGAMVRLTGASSLTVTDTTPAAGAGRLLHVNGGAVNASAPIVRAQDGSTITTGAELIKVGAGTLTATSDEFLVHLSDSHLSLKRSLISTDGGGALSLAGGLLAADSSRIAVSGSDLAGLGGPAVPLATTATAPLIDLLDTQVAAPSGSLLRVMTCCSATGAPVAGLSLAGPLLAATGSAILTGSTTLDLGLCCEGLAIASTAAQALATLASTPVTARDSFLRLATTAGCCPDLTGRTLGINLSGPAAGAAFPAAVLLSATDSPLLLDGSLVDLSASSCCGAAAALTVASSQPLAALLRSPVDAAGDMLDVFVASSGPGAAAAILPGPFLRVEDSVLGLDGDVVEVDVIAGAAAALTSEATSALVSLVRSPAMLPDDGVITLRVNGGTAASLTLQGPPAGAAFPAAVLLSAVDSPILAEDDEIIEIGVSASAAGGTATLSSASTSPWVALDSSPVTSPYDQFTSASVSANLIAGLTLGGPFLHTVDSALALGDTLIDVNVSTGGGAGSAAAFTSGAPAALVTLERSPVTTEGHLMSLRLSGATARLDLAGPAAGAAFPAAVLLSAVDSPIVTQLGVVALDVSGCCTAGATARLQVTSPSPLVALQRSPVAADGRFLGLAVSSASTTTLSLQGSLLRAAESAVVASGELIDVSASACCDAGAAATLTSATSEPWVRLDASPVTTTSGATVSLCCDGVTMTLGGPLLQATDSPISSGGGDTLLDIAGASVTSAATGPFIALARSPFHSDGDFVHISGGALNLAGPLVTTDTLIVVDGRVITLCCPGGTLTSTTLEPLISLTGASLVSRFGSFLDAFSGSTVSLRGSLLSATDSVLTFGNGLVRVDSSALTTAVPAAAAYPLVALNGGALVVGDAFTSGRLFDLNGTTLDPVPDPDTGVQLGTDQPLRHQGGGAVLEVTGTSTVPALVDVRGPSGTAVRVDRALLEASAPLLNLRTNASLTTSGHAIDLVSRAHLRSLLPADALIKLDAAMLSVANGHLVNVAGGSRLGVAGNLVSLAGGSTLNLLNGLLLNVTGGSIASIAGALVAFSGGGNTINVTNTFAPTGYVAGIPVFSSLGGTTGLTVTNANPLAGLNTAGTIRINGATLPTGATAGMTGSLVAVQGSGTVKIGP